MIIKLPKISSVTAITILFAFTPPPATAQFIEDDEVGFADITVCKPGQIDVPRILRDAPGGNTDEQPITIEADQIQASDSQQVVLSGNAMVQQGKRAVFADTITYNQESYRANAEGNVVFYTPTGDEIRAGTMELEVDTFIGEAEDVSIRIVDTNPDVITRRHTTFDEDYSIFAPLTRTVRVDRDREDAEEDEKKERKYYQRARATGESMQFEGEGYEVLQNAVMTTCPDGNEDVTLTAKEVELDHATGIGTAKNMTVRLKSIPIFYFPSVSFPINDERKTGFLFPAIGDEEDSGLILEIPYYINIAPHMDATITPRIMTERGIQLYSEFRYIGERTTGALKAEYLPSDDVFGDDRHAIGFNHDQRFGDKWQGVIDLQDVSDSAYFRDFSNNVDVISYSYVTQRGRVSRLGEYINFNARVQTQDSINDGITAENLPYDILPEVNLNLRPQELGIFEAELETKLTQFDHESSTRVTGTRTRVVPSISVPLKEIYGSLEPRVSPYNLAYSLDNTTGEDDSQSASIPVYSVNGDLVLLRERP